MTRSSISDRLTRSERNYLEVEFFLNSSAESKTIFLYSGEIKRLEKDFPQQITITKGERYRNHLYNCTVTRKK